MRKLLSTTVAGGAAALALVALAAAPAAAGTADSQFDVVFPGQKPQTTYYVENTGNVSGGVTGKSVVSWGIIDDQVVDNSKRFTSFKITTRIEERLTKTSGDHVVTSKTCDLTKLVNDNYSWFAVDPANTCVAPSAVYDGGLWWSTDATIVYDIEGDGKGAVTQETLGSPLIHG
ncbi:hypothetical protein [Streptomyces purpurascens]|uniref:Secreted protein n=1 Tax=Streptomyces purpurascens TaxID=1924 RepID=A0ABZ1MIH9_STREF|nr:hypothetical protein [Streptomyces purpurascens]MCE7044949.1 hypothetical protein [Streptomyces purpurascens]GHA13875.1 hypothetical protein GCM10010303_25070 [Streptomyces purpurascens]